MYLLIFFIIGLAVFLFIPSLIVIFWKRRPVWAFAISSIIAYFTFAAPGIIKTLQAMMIYGTGDPELMAGGISEALVNALFALPILLPILALIQWIARRRWRKKQISKLSPDTFS